MKVVQCWDDGVTADARLIEILRKYNAKATFNLNAASHKKNRSEGWTFKGTQVARLGWDEMKSLYSGFKIANHSLSHPHLEQLPVEDARRDIAEGRDQLEQFFGVPVTGFAYPFGTYNEAVMEAVRETGHVYARTTLNVDYPFPPEDPMAFHPNCHFLAADFWTRYEKARSGGVFYFWGHSYEIINDLMWVAFEEIIKQISHDTESCWCDVIDLFDVAKSDKSCSCTSR
jgi:peptidoglycan/xylan/chitin deacetylase (PgdA/CDA1 family)